MDRAQNFLRWQGPWLLTCAVIFYLSSKSNFPIGLPIPQGDKLAHGIIYFALGILVLRGFRKISWFSEGLPAGYFAWGILFCLVYGVSDEWHQSFVPGRATEFWDWTADAVGAGLAGFIYFLYRKMKLGSL